MLNTCILCGMKHLGRASGFLTEAGLGYPHRIGNAIGELSLAEEELFNSHPDLASDLRQARIAYQDEVMLGNHASFPVDEFMRRLHELLVNPRVSCEVKADS